MKAVVPAVIFMLAACTSAAPPVASVTSSPTASPIATPIGSPTISPTTAARPAPAVSLTSLGASLNCRLPVVWTVQDGQTQTSEAGFMAFPGATLLADPSAPAHSVFYDRLFARWLPAGRDSVSPDGTRYAYSEGNAYQNTAGKLHVVNVATGVDTVIYSGPRVYAVVDFAVEGIYLTGATPEGRPHGLWLQDPAGGPARLISSDIVAPAVGGGAAWGVNFNTADPSPGPGGLEGPRNGVLRFDLRTGASTPWFYRPGSDLYIMGFDPAGHPLVSAVFNPSPATGEYYEAWLVQSSTAATRLAITTGSAPAPSRVAAIDRHGVWLDSYYGPPGGAWLFASSSIQLVATVTGAWLKVAGGCIP